MIRDFFKVHKVKVDHGDDLVYICNLKLYLIPQSRKPSEYNHISGNDFTSNASEDEEAMEDNVITDELSKVINELKVLREKVK